MADKRLVPDANIPIRAVPGVRVRSLVEALLPECPIRTGDRDFFGSGVPAWTAATVERFLREP